MIGQRTSSTGLEAGWCRRREQLQGMSPGNLCKLRGKNSLRTRSGRKRAFGRTGGRPLLDERQHSQTAGFERNTGTTHLLNLAAFVSATTLETIIKAQTARQTSLLEMGMLMEGGE